MVMASSTTAHGVWADGGGKSTNPFVWRRDRSTFNTRAGIFNRTYGEHEITSKRTKSDTNDRQNS